MILRIVVLRPVHVPGREKLWFCGTSFRTCAVAF